MFRQIGKKRRKKPVFIHISKNAGTSIVKSARKAIVVAGHRTAADWVSENGHDTSLFAIIRNPFDRVVSEYFYRKRRFDAGEKNAHLANLHNSFEEWVVATFHDGEFRTAEFFEQTGVFYNPKNMIGDTLIWFLPQIQWVGGLKGGILVDTLLRYEYLDRDWECFSKQYQIHRCLRYHNRSRRNKGYKQYYSAETRKIIEDYFQEDLETFNYHFL